MCVPKYCEADADCPGDMICNIALDFQGDPYIVGFCAFPSNDPNAAGPGERCDDDRNVCDVICLGEGDSSYCAHMCDDDSDCVNGTCSIINFGIDNAGNSAPAQLCVLVRSMMLASVPSSVFCDTWTSQVSFSTFWSGAWL